MSNTHTPICTLACFIYLGQDVCPLQVALLHQLRYTRAQQAIISKNNYVSQGKEHCPSSPTRTSAATRARHVEKYPIQLAASNTWLLDPKGSHVAHMAQSKLAVPWDGEQQFHREHTDAQCSLSSYVCGVQVLAGH